MKNLKNHPPDGTESSVNCPTNKGPGKYLSGGNDEAVLIRRCRKGNMAAFGQLIEQYQDRLFNTVFRVVGNRDDALELTQEAFYRALKGLPKFRGNAGFFTWLYRIGMNLCINFHRRRQRVQITSLSGGEDGLGRQADTLAQMAEAGDYSPVQQLQIKESHNRALTALRQLEPSARAVVVLRDIEELNYAQISEILEVPVGTVKSRLARARAVLREQLQE